MYEVMRAVLRGINVDITVTRRECLLRNSPRELFVVSENRAGDPDGLVSATVHRRIDPRVSLFPRDSSNSDKKRSALGAHVLVSRETAEPRK